MMELQRLGALHGGDGDGGGGDGPAAAAATTNIQAREPTPEEAIELLSSPEPELERLGDSTVGHRSQRRRRPSAKAAAIAEAIKDIMIDEEEVAERRQRQVRRHEGLVELIDIDIGDYQEEEEDTQSLFERETTAATMTSPDAAPRRKRRTREETSSQAALRKEQK